jgi:putative inorganic carbon (HCO3(-)) transporter
MVLSIAANPLNLSLSLKHLIRWMSPILILLVVTDTIREKEDVKRLIGAILLSGGLLSLMGIIQFLVGAERIRDFLNTDIAALLLNRHIIEAGELNLFIGNYSYVRAFGTFTNVNTFSAYLGWIIPLSLVFLVSKISIYRRYWLGLVALLLGNVLILISSRAGFLGLLSATSLIFFLIKKKEKVWLICWLGLLVVTACIFFPKAFLTLSQRGIEAVSGGVHSVTGGAHSVSGGAHSVTSRFFIWKKGLEMIKEHPLLGVGPGNYRIEVPKDISSRPTLPPHNMFLLVAGEMGIPGLLIYLWILWIIFKEIVVLFNMTTDLEVRSIALGLLAGLIWFIVQSFFSHFLPDIKYGMLFWLMVGVSFSLKSIHSLKIHLDNRP